MCTHAHRHTGSHGVKRLLHKNRMICCKKKINFHVKFSNWSFGRSVVMVSTDRAWSQKVHRRRFRRRLAANSHEDCRSSLRNRHVQASSLLARLPFLASDSALSKLTASTASHCMADRSEMEETRRASTPRTESMMSTPNGRQKGGKQHIDSKRRNWFPHFWRRQACLSKC